MQPLISGKEKKKQLSTIICFFIFCSLQSANAAKNSQPPIDQSRMDIDTSDIIITGSNNTRVSQKEVIANFLLTVHLFIA